MTLAWLLVQLVGYLAAFALVLAGLVAAVAGPPIVTGYWLAGWWSRRSTC